MSEYYKFLDKFYVTKTLHAFVNELNYCGKQSMKDWLPSIPTTIGECPWPAPSSINASLNGIQPFRWSALRKIKVSCLGTHVRIKDFKIKKKRKIKVTEHC